MTNDEAIKLTILQRAALSAWERLMREHSRRFGIGWYSSAGVAPLVDAETVEQSMRLQERIAPAFDAALRADATDEDLARAALALAIAKVLSLGLDLQTTIHEATEIVGSA